MRAAFLDAMRTAGIVPSEQDRIAADGTLCRFHVEGDKRGARNGWAVLHQDGLASGAFGHWRTGRHATWCSGSRDSLMPAERARMDAAIAEAKREREAQRLALAHGAQARARSMWAQAATPADHPYLVTKGTGAYGIRQRNDCLLIPLRDGDGVLWNVQTIATEGTKRFLYGGRKRGLYHAIGGAVDELLCITEGYATGASIHEATGNPVAVAFDCGNLLPVAKVLRAKYPHATITICADNDTHTAGNPGLTAARAAAEAIGGKVAIPPEPHNDFNDAAREVQA
ncbi:MAG: toprim domain-containing protein [Rhodanobacter sp.]|nr:MAG: toprim domain-containing protein [Rhodanobacter sp.]TAL92303.1 MAG: toprim domain-containing protein [Rhodanobacter sp.]TAM40281.1 MAG: toprim domain-containing protein [Rhodanobacter sp.]